MIHGMKYNMLTIIGLDYIKNGKKHYKCKCDCGNIKTIQQTNIKNNHTKSCGCLRVKTSRQRMTTHGMTKTRIYNIWASMIQRCMDKKHKHYNLYGGKGIEVCQRWNVFELFYQDMGNGYSDNLTIERVDSNKGYNKENCRWATRIEQNNNTSRNRIVAIDNVTDTLANMCRRYKLPYNTISLRVNQLGWSDEKAFKTPIRKRRDAI